MMRIAVSAPPTATAMLSVATSGRNRLAVTNTTIGMVE
jgi:hypothetical protein